MSKLKVGDKVKYYNGKYVAEIIGKAKEDYFGRDYAISYLDKENDRINTFARKDDLTPINEGKDKNKELRKRIKRYWQREAENEIEAVEKSLEKWRIIKEIRERGLTDVVNFYENIMCGYCDLYMTYSRIADDELIACPNCPVKEQCAKIRKGEMSLDEAIEFLEQRKTKLEFPFQEGDITKEKSTGKKYKIEKISVSDDKLILKRSDGFTFDYAPAWKKFEENHTLIWREEE